MKKMKLGSSMQKRSIINTTYLEDDQDILGFQNIDQIQKEEFECSFVISEIIVVYYTVEEGYGYSYNVFVGGCSITLLNENLIQTTIYFDKYDIKDKSVIFYNGKNHEVACISNLDENSTFLSEFEEKMMDGKALGLAEYLKNKNIDTSEEKKYLKNIDPIIFWSAQQYLAQWKIDEFKKKIE